MSDSAGSTDANANANSGAAGHAAGANALPASPAATLSGASDCDVLVVDDNPNVNKALSALLRRAGFNPISCHRGADAMAYVQGDSAPRPPRPPRAAVIDVHLPDINGLVLARQMRDRFGPQTPIVVVSGDTSMETINSLTHIGATYFFSKPVNAAALVQQLRHLTGGPDRAACVG